jgi:hypothetical protein
MKILRIFGPIVGLYILLRALAAFLLPRGEDFMRIINMLLVLAFMIGILVLPWLGKPGGKAMRGKRRRISYFAVIMALLSLALLFRFGMNGDILYEFIENVVPFGVPIAGVIAKMLGLTIRVSTRYETIGETGTSFPFFAWGSIKYLIESIFKLLIAVVIYPVVTEKILGPFFGDNDPENKIWPEWFQRGVIYFFGAVITSFASMFLVARLGGLIIENFGEAIGFVFHILGSVAFAVAIVLIITKLKFGVTSVRFLGSLIKMLVVNVGCVLVIIIFQYDNIYKAFLALLACVAICVLTDAFVMGREYGGRK